MSKNDFEADYCIGSAMSREEYNQHFVTLPCRCRDNMCGGWAAVSNDERSIKTHNDLYNEG